MRYTVICPIYNSEATLQRCLDSLLSQPCPDAELLLINDGSTDRSGEICQEYARRYPNLICRTTENRGVSAARNLGLELAQGTYILFVDSDDYVSPDYFRAIDRSLAQGDPASFHRTEKPQVSGPTRFRWRIGPCAAGRRPCGLWRTICAGGS